MLSKGDGWTDHRYTGYTEGSQFTHTYGRKQAEHPGKPEGVIALADAISAYGALAKLDISKNALCGIDEYGNGEYDASGMTALADAIKKHQ